MMDNLYTVSLPVERIKLRMGETVALTAMVLNRNGKVPAPVDVTFSISSDDAGHPRVSQGDGQWMKGVSVKSDYRDGTATVFIKAGPTTDDIFKCEVEVVGKSDQIVCQLDVKGTQVVPAAQVSALEYVGGNEQFAWNSPGYNLFHEPLSVRALDASGQPVADASVTFKVNKPASAAMTADRQFTNAGGNTFGAFLIAKNPDTLPLSVTAMCNGYHAEFTGLFVVDSSSQIQMGSTDISVGRQIELMASVTGPAGEVWHRLPVLARLSGESDFFFFPDARGAGSLTLYCDARGKVKFTVSCNPDTRVGDTQVLSMQSGPLLSTVMLKAKD